MRFKTYLASNRTRIAASIFPILLLTAMHAANAEILYQWREPDGTLTFSPTPPPEGSNVHFTVVKPDDTINPIALPAEGQQLSTLSGNSTSQPAQQVRTANQTSSVQLAYAPSTSKPQTTIPETDLPQGITAASISQINSDQHTDGGSDTDNQALQASLRKKQQCGDLNKRIIALENRMSHSQNNAEMDQAVLQIMRYQTSYDSFCDRQ